MQNVIKSNRMKFVMPLAALLTVGCDSLALSPTPPVLKTSVPVSELLEKDYPLTTVKENVAFAKAMNRLYEGSAGNLRSYAYFSSLPFYAAAIATGAILLHGAETNIIADLGLGVGGYYTLTQSLDFSGRAEVLNDATAKWKCFAEHANRVAFADRKSDGKQTGEAKRIGARYGYLSRNLSSARAYLDHGGTADTETITALKAAFDSGTKSLLVAERNGRDLGNVKDTLDKYRDSILNAVNISYSGKMKSFNYKEIVNQLSVVVGEEAKYKADAQSARDAVANAPKAPGTPVPAQDKGTLSSMLASSSLLTTDSSQAVRDLMADPTDKGAIETLRQEQLESGLKAEISDVRAMRALTYRLNEMSLELANDSDGAALASLPVELAKCVQAPQ